MIPSKNVPPMFKKGEVLVLNADLQQYMFKSAAGFQQVYVNAYKDIMQGGSVLDFTENPNSVAYVLMNLNKVLNGEKINKIPGDNIQYEKVKCVVIDVFSEIQDMMFDYSDKFQNPPGKNGKDKRISYFAFESEYKSFMRWLKFIPIPMLVLTHCKDFTPEGMPRETHAYTVSKGTRDQVDKSFSCRVYTSVDRNMDIKKKEAYRFKLFSDGDTTVKGLYELYDEDVYYMDNDANALLYDVSNHLKELATAQGVNFLPPKILIVGLSGTGKSTSLRNLCESS